MIATELYDGQGLGNQLWAYVACRSISEKLQLPYAILAPERFKGASFLDIDIGSSLEWAGPGEANSVVVSSFHERLYYDHELRYFASEFDEGVLDLPPNTRIEGLFQSEKYFFGNLALPKKYITIKSSFLEGDMVPEDCCVLNIRGGEYKRHKDLVLPKSYWLNAMRNMQDLHGIKRFLMVSDDPMYAKALFPSLPVLDGGVAECYVALHQANYLILSNTSFAYFPVKTSDNKVSVIAPMHWARHGNKYMRWASPANLYESWVWQDVDGSLHSYLDCVHIQARTSAYYRKNYYVCTSPCAVRSGLAKKFLPRWMVKLVKRGLSLLLPKHIG